MMTYAVYMVADDACGQDEVMVQGGFTTEAEAEQYMAQYIADEVAEYGEQVDEYYVAEEI